MSARPLGVSRSLTRAADGLSQARDPAMTGRSRRPVCRAERLAGGRRSWAGLLDIVADRTAGTIAFADCDRTIAFVAVVCRSFRP